MSRHHSICILDWSLASSALVVLAIFGECKVSGDTRCSEIQVYVLQHHPVILLDAFELASILEYYLRSVASTSKDLIVASSDMLVPILDTDKEYGEAITVTEPFCGSAVVPNADMDVKSIAQEGNTETCDTSIIDAMVTNDTLKKPSDTYYYSLLCIEEEQPINSYEKHISLQVPMEHMGYTSKANDDLLYGTHFLISDAKNDFFAMITPFDIAFSEGEELQIVPSHSVIQLGAYLHIVDKGRTYTLENGSLVSKFIQLEKFTLTSLFFLANYVVCLDMVPKDTSVGFNADVSLCLNGRARRLPLIFPIIEATTLVPGVSDCFQG